MVFAIVPDSLIETGDKERIGVYCILYLLEFKGKKYNLRKIADDSKLTYRQCRSLKDLAKTTIKQVREKNAK